MNRQTQTSDPRVEDMISRLKAMVADRRVAGAPGVPTDEEIESILRGGDAERKARAGNIRQALRRRRKGGGKKRTPSLEEAYGSLIRQGLVKIIRKKGRAPQVIFMPPG